MIGLLATAVDLLLGLTLLGLAAYLLHTRDDFRAVVLFMVLGLSMALVWARLRAPDIALAEAALGAGFTGALLIVAQHRFRKTSQRERPAPEPRGRSR